MQAEWDWCHVCGFDPDGLKPPEPDWRDLPSPRFGETPEWGAPIGQPSGFAPGVGAPQWGPPPVGPGLATNGHAHPKPPRSAATIVLLVLAGLVVAGVLVIGGLVLAVTLLGRSGDVVGSSQTGATVPPGSARWVAPDGSVGADFPATPTMGPSVPPTHNTRAGTSWSLVTPSATYFVTMAPLTPGARIDATATLNGGIDGFNRNYPGTFHERTPTTVEGFKAEKFSVTGTSGTMVRGTVVVSPHGLYIIAAAGPPSEQAALDAFGTSLQIPT